MAEKYYCKWCGQSFSSVSALANMSCSKNQEGKRHELYEGDEKSQYVCKHCGQKFSSLSALCNMSCSKSPHGKHSPAL
jgi:DNA-directed RNA polymerase subunit RPC12/RpoP